MKYLWAVAAACALLASSALAQQYPQNQYPSPNQGTNQTDQSGGTYTPNPQQDQAYPQQSYPQQGYPSQTGTYQPYGAVAVIPAGTDISIRTNEQITADQNNTGRQYSAEISKDVVGPNGQVLIPRGSPATLTVSDISNGTMGVGSKQVGLALQSVNYNGRTYMVQAASQTESGNRGIGANKRTAVMTGGGALLGTILGAAVGGGKGAAIGAVLGAGGGAAAQVLTRGSQVNVPAETVLTFKLDQPLTLQ